MPYKRELLMDSNGNPCNTLAVFGKLLYGFVYDGQAFPFVFSDDNGNNWKAFNSPLTLQQIYNNAGLTWPNPSPYPMQILYQSVPGANPPNIVYIATSDGHIISNSYDNSTGQFPANPGDQWTDLTVPPPQNPQNTTTIGRYTNAMVNGPTLFYGCYNQDNVADDGKGMAPYNCANLYSFDASDPNAVWVQVLEIPGARHMHSVEVDPSDHTKVYAVAGDGGSHGLWYSGDGGTTFEHVSGWILAPGSKNGPKPNTQAASRYGIDMVFPPKSNLILLEADGPCCTTDKAMILAFDKTKLPLPGQLQDSTVQITNPPAVPSGVHVPAGVTVPTWQGSSYGSLITSKGNLFFISSGENGGIGLRDGVWLSKAPTFGPPTLLEDLNPPVISVTQSGPTSVVIVTTASQQSWDNTSVVFGYYDANKNFTLFPADGTSIPVQSVAGNQAQFQFPTKGNQLPAGWSTKLPLVGGVAKLMTGWEYVKTFEQGGFFFNGPYRLTVPE